MPAEAGIQAGGFARQFESVGIAKPKKHVIPAKAGIQVGRRWHAAWAPAFAGVTKWDGD